jgi:hypothetical protein
MQKRKQANSHMLTGSREEQATVSKTQHAEEGASRVSHPDMIQGRKNHFEQETTCRRRSQQILTH